VTCAAPDPAQLIASVNVAGPHDTSEVKVPGTFALAQVKPNTLVGSTWWSASCANVTQRRTDSCRLAQPRAGAEQDS
jgi:hypothetical protein